MGNQNNREALQQKILSVIIEFTSEDELVGICRGIKIGLAQLMPQVWSEDDLIVTTTPATPVE